MAYNNVKVRERQIVSPSSTREPLGVVSGVPMNEWNVDISYEKLNIVTYKNSTFIAKRANKGIPPIDTPNWKDTWMVLLSGLGISTVVTEYALGSTSSSEPPQDGWSADIPALKAGEYLWVRVTITYADGEQTVFYTVGAGGVPIKTSELVNDGDGTSPFTTEKNLQAETERATAAEQANAEAVKNEAARAKGAEQANEEAIETEVARAKAAEKTNAGGIAANAQAIATERERAENVESGLDTRVKSIESKIPTDASADNPLETRSFVNSSINALAAFFITPTATGDKAWASRAALLTATTFYSGGKTRVPTQNDYAIVLADESQAKGVDGTYPTTRYSYQGGTYPSGQWDFQYIVNNTSLTQAQVNALNSGITAAYVAQITTNKSDIAALDTRIKTIEGKYVTLDTYQEIESVKVFMGQGSSVRNTYSALFRNSVAVSNGTDFTVKTATLYEYGKITQSNNYARTEFLLPNVSGTLALVSDITWANIPDKPTIPDISDLVTTNTEQTITAKKEFYETSIEIHSTSVGIAATTTLDGYGVSVHASAAHQGDTTTEYLAGRIGYTNANGDYLSYSFPDKEGTLALLEDLPNVSNFVTTNTTQEITAQKTITFKPLWATFTGTTECRITGSDVTISTDNKSTNSKGSTQYGRNGITYTLYEGDGTFIGSNYLAFPQKAGINSGTIALIEDITWANIPDKPTIPDISNLVTTNTEQTITSMKRFYGGTWFDGMVYIGARDLPEDDSGQWNREWGVEVTGRDGVAVSTLHADRIGYLSSEEIDYNLYFPKKSGTFATLDDIKWVNLPDKPTIPTIPNLSRSVSGSGNAVTDITVSGHAITVTKGETFALKTEIPDVSKYLPLAGGELTGSLKIGSATIQTNGYITGTWLQTTSTGTHLTTAATKVAVLDGSGWIYHRTPAELLSDMGGASTSYVDTKATWNNITGKPSWIGSTKPSYTWTEIGSKPSWIGSSKPSYSYSEISNTPTALKNPNALKITVGGTTITYDGSSAQSVTISSGARPLGKIYGVSGMGSVTPIWQRTYDAAGITLSLNDQSGNSNLVNFVLSDNAMQEFFHFQETTDKNGNVFLVIPPMSFRYDRINENEIQAMSVKLYEDGDEKYGFELHPAFKKWTSNAEYSGYGSIQIAKYMSSPYDTIADSEAEGNLSDRSPDEIKVRSVAGVSYALSYVNWSAGLEMIKATDPTYRMLHWSYRDLIVKLASIFFARSDIYNMLGLVDGQAFGATTGTTDELTSHSGFNRETGQIKLFGMDAAFAATNLNGIYRNSDDAIYYTHLTDTNAETDEGYIKSSLSVPSASYDGYHIGSITKISVDNDEKALGTPTAWIHLPEDEEACYEGNYSKYYSSRWYDWGTPSNRGQMWAFNKWVSYDEMLFVEDGLFFVLWVSWFDYAWAYDYVNGGALRLCKMPS